MAGSLVIDVVMPQLGESVDTGTISRWLKAAGEPVAVDEPLYEVSSDKVTMAVPALVAGFVREIIATEGQEVGVGCVVARIGTSVRPGESESAATVAPGIVATTTESTASENRVPETSTKRERLSPAVRRLLRDSGLDAASLSGSAENGRITKADVLARLGIAAAAPGVRRVPLSRTRLHAIERLSAAQKSAVNVFSVVEVDMDTVAAERKRRGLTYLAFVARATIDALCAHEILNASLDEARASIDYHDAVHLGVAVDLDERGLVVPVVRDAQRLTLTALAAEIARLAEGARTLKLRPDEYTGSTFTISNNGSFGTLLTAPVINAPNVAIVSSDAVELRPVVIDGMIAIRHRMYVCMTWDHRALDGSTAARFLGRIKKNLETWDWSVR